MKEQGPRLQEEDELGEQYHHQGLWGHREAGGLSGTLGSSYEHLGEQASKLGPLGTGKPAWCPQDQESPEGLLLEGAFRGMERMTAQGREKALIRWGWVAAPTC